MFHFLADHNFNGKIVAGVLQRTANAHVLQAWDAGLSRTLDPALLEWAAENGCLVLSHDVNTLIGYAYQRVEIGLPTPGVFAARSRSLSAAPLRTWCWWSSAAIQQSGKDRYTTCRCMVEQAVAARN